MRLERKSKLGTIDYVIHLRDRVYNEMTVMPNSHVDCTWFHINQQITNKSNRDIVCIFAYLMYDIKVQYMSHYSKLSTFLLLRTYKSLLVLKGYYYVYKVERQTNHSSIPPMILTFSSRRYSYITIELCRKRASI